MLQKYNINKRFCLKSMGQMIGDNRSKLDQSTLLILEDKTGMILNILIHHQFSKPD